MQYGVNGTQNSPGLVKVRSQQGKGGERFVSSTLLDDRVEGLHNTGPCALLRSVRLPHRNEEHNRRLLSPVDTIMLHPSFSLCPMKHFYDINN